MRMQNIVQPSGRHNLEKFSHNEIWWYVSKWASIESNQWLTVLYTIIIFHCIRMQSKYFFFCLGSLIEHHFHFVNQSKGHIPTKNGPIDLKWLYSIERVFFSGGVLNICIYILLSDPFLYLVVVVIVVVFFRCCLSFVCDILHLHTIKQQCKQITNWCISIARKLANLSGNY